MPSASHEQRKNNLRANDNMVYDVIESMPVDKNSGVLSDETIRLIGYYSISNSIGQVLFRRADIRELYNQPTLPVNVPEAESVEQLTLW